MIFTIIRYHYDYVFIKPFLYYQRNSLYLDGDNIGIFNNIWDTDKIAIVVILCKCVCFSTCLCPSISEALYCGEWCLKYSKGYSSTIFFFFFNAYANFPILRLRIYHASPSKTHFQLRITPERNDMIFDATDAKIVKMIYIWYSI